MKKALVLGLILAGATFGYSQGQVSFVNTPATFSTAAGTAANGHTDRLVYWTDNTTGLLGTNWVAQLYYNAGAAQAEGNLHVISGDTATPFRVGPAGGGIWNGGGTKTFTDVAAGGTATLQVRVWDGSLYGTYAAAVTAGGVTGKSAAFNYTAPTPPSTATAMEGLQSFTLQVPEPSTIALGVLGAASLLVVRRRK